MPTLLAGPALTVGELPGGWVDEVAFGAATPEERLVGAGIGEADAEPSPGLVLEVGKPPPGGAAESST